MPGEYQSFVTLDVWTMIFSWCNILILYVILKKLLFKPVKNIIDTRQRQIDEMYAEANKTRSNAEGMRAEYEEKLSRAAAESEELMKTTVRRAQLKEEEILREAQSTASKTLKRAQEQVEMEKKRAMNEMKNELSDMAIEIAAAVLERDVNDQDNARIIDQFIENLGDRS